ncbi:DUF7006 family protein [Enterococcus sp. DIV1297f]|uniref:DUF7006 family protein n=1 Tax=Enterococcus sp. DIV1297f TaxID=2774691 RepID=UPI003D2DF7ED
MVEFLTKETYLKGFQIVFDEAEKRDDKDLKIYLQTLVQRLETLIARITPENFWHVWSEILGIDAKFGIVAELIVCEEFSDKEIIRIVENDYRTYFKELCGYNLSMAPNFSIIFNVI